MSQKPEAMYLDLLKKTLSFSLWPEPPMPIGYFRSTESTSFSKRVFAPRLSKFLGKFGFQLVMENQLKGEDRAEGLFWPGYADSMIGAKRLDNVQFCVETVLREKVPGDLIETGVWRGGAVILMRAILAVNGVTDRKVFAADSFEGLPRPDEKKWPVDKGDHHYSHPFLAVSVDTVKSNFKKYGLLDEQVVFLKGWFKDTLPGAPIDKISVLRLDGDMYGSTMDAIEPLYPKLSSGGFCIVDDYNLPGCRQAIDDYRSRNGITEQVHPTDKSGVYWRKP